MSEPNLRDYPTISSFIGGLVEFSPGALVHRAAEDLARLARQLDRRMLGTFNDVEMHANPDDSAARVLAEFDAMRDRRNAEYQPVPPVYEPVPEVTVGPAVISTPEEVVAYAEAVLGGLAYVEAFRVQVLAALLSNPSVEPRLPREDLR